MNWARRLRVPISRRRTFGALGAPARGYPVPSRRTFGVLGPPASGSHIPSPDVRLRPPGYGSLGPACAPASCLRWSATPASGTRGARSLLQRLIAGLEDRLSRRTEVRQENQGHDGEGFREDGGEGLPLPLRRRMWATPRETWHRAIFPLADLRRLLITRASGPDAEGVGAGLCPATVSRRRRRDGGDGATASP